MKNRLGARAPLPLNFAGGPPGFVNLSWSSSTGEFFNVEFSTNLAQGFIAWQTNILATPPTNVVPVPVSDDASFYRPKF